MLHSYFLASLSQFLSFAFVYTRPLEIKCLPLVQLATKEQKCGSSMIANIDSVNKIVPVHIRGVYVCIVDLLFLSI